MCDKVCQREGVKIGPKQRNVVYGQPLLRDFTVGCITVGVQNNSEAKSCLN